MKQGREEGLKQGREEMREEMFTSLISMWHKEGKSAEEISLLLKLPIDDVIKVING